MADFVIQKATVNGATRRDTLSGREHLIVPVVAIVQGVLNDEFVPAQEIEKSLPAWNGRPITLSHPEDEIGPISANSPAVLEKWGMGYLFNCAFSKGDRLTGEMWLDVGMATQKGGEAQEAIERYESGQSTEVSTGYFRDIRNQAGDWNGRPYTAIQSAILPDHLAILLNEQGACNWQDGCGAPRVNTAAKPCGCKEHRMKKVIVNVELSLDEQLSRVYDAFWQMFERPDGMREIWPREVFSEVVIASNGTQLLAYPWTADEEGVITFGTPAIVEVVYQDVETGQSVIGNTSRHVGIIQRFISQLARAITGNGAAVEVEEEPEIEPEGITPFIESEPAAVDPPNQDDPGRAGEGDEIVSNAITEMLERLGGPEAVERDIMALRANNAAARQQRIARLTANERCAFTAEELATWNEEALGKLERSLTPADYSGRGVPRAHTNEPDEEVLVMPALSLNGAGK